MLTVKNHLTISFVRPVINTIDVGLVANWLVRLTPEQHERFMQLKERFSSELENRDLVKDMEDHAHAEEKANAQRNTRTSRLDKRTATAGRIPA